MCCIHTIEYYSTIERNKVLIHVNWINLGDIILSERNQSQNITYLSFPFYEISRIGKFRKTESRLVVARGRVGLGQNGG